PERSPEPCSYFNSAKHDEKRSLEILWPNPGSDSQTARLFGIIRADRANNPLRGNGAMANPLRDGDPNQVGPYELHARLGGGGMGRVFLGRSPGGHTVAVKVVRPELADDATFRRRFASEVAAARTVGGFYTAPVVDADPDADPPWLATAYIPGPSLHTAVADHGPLPLASVAVLGAGLAEGLAAVHIQKLVHRDLKPANIILGADGPRLIDFGIARALDTTSHTQTSTVLGTAAFMSPEQAMAQQVSPASDVFSLGCVLAFAATGHSPFGEGPVHAVVFRVVHEEPDLSDLPAPLVDLVSVCLAKDPAARPALEHLLRELSALVPPVEERPEGRWLPEALTEVITLHTTLVLDPVPSDRTRAFESEMRAMLHARLLNGVNTLISRRRGQPAAPDRGLPPRPGPTGQRTPERSHPQRQKGIVDAQGGSSKRDDAKKTSGGHGWWKALAFAAVALFLYAFVSPVASVVGLVLNGGTDSVARGDCVGYMGTELGYVKLPCLAANAQYTVLGRAITLSYTRDGVSHHGCTGVPGWREAEDTVVGVGEWLACVEDND
uniref:serine/threonine-protein kinase n=1 Tax=Nocardiopsis sp. FIRDI 009 TaxID=714197 RepID=UPI001E5B30C6